MRTGPRWIDNDRQQDPIWGGEERGERWGKGVAHHKRQDNGVPSPPPLLVYAVAMTFYHAAWSSRRHFDGDVSFDLSDVKSHIWKAVGDAE